VNILLRVYAKCIHGQQDEAKRRILDATQDDEASGTAATDRPDEDRDQ
jgi:hypothetical protein